MAGPEDKKEDDDLLAAEWAALAEGNGQDSGAGGGAGGGGMGDFGGDVGGDVGGDGGPTRVLDQDAIDSLLGFDDGGGGGGDGSGIAAIVNSALVSYERLPMLEVVFDRLVRMMSTSLRNFTSD